MPNRTIEYFINCTIYMQLIFQKLLSLAPPKLLIILLDLQQLKQYMESPQTSITQEKKPALNMMTNEGTRHLTVKEDMPT